MSKADVPAAIAKWEKIVAAHRYPHPLITVDLVLALIWQESSGDPWAIRYEPHYQYFYEYKDKRALYNKTQDNHTNRANAYEVLGPTEFQAQSTSWGLLQILGAPARERGFMGRYLSELCDSAANIKFGTKHLYEYAFSHGSRPLDIALARWNGSSTYAAKVIEKLKVVQA